MLWSAASAQMALTITREIKDVAVKAGESALFECHMIGPADMDVDWLSNGKLIQPALLNCKMHFDGKRWVKVFTNVFLLCLMVINHCKQRDFIPCFIIKVPSPSQFST